MIAKIDIAGLAAELASDKVEFEFDGDQWIDDNQSEYTDEASECYIQANEHFIEVISNHLVTETIKIEK